MTGASSGMGRRLLRRLWADPAWAGVVFVVVGRDSGVHGSGKADGGRFPDGSGLDALCEEARALGCRAECLRLDLSQAGAMDTAAAALRGLPPVKGFVLAAGLCQDQILARMELADFERVWAVNTGFHARLLDFLSGPGRLAKGARGLLVGSQAGQRGNAGQSAYAAAKGALGDLLAMAPQGLRLNLLLPPLMPSPMLDALSPRAREALFRTRLMDDPDPAQSCADAAHFLLSDDASYIHRQTIHADTRVSALGFD
jgi:3-oxoacyl-[acyl-carrier protein] reductase